MKWKNGEYLKFLLISESIYWSFNIKKTKRITKTKKILLWEPNSHFTGLEKIVRIITLIKAARIYLILFG